MTVPRSRIAARSSHVESAKSEINFQSRTVMNLPSFPISVLSQLIYLLFSVVFALSSRLHVAAVIFGVRILFLSSTKKASVHTAPPTDTFDTFLFCEFCHHQRIFSISAHRCRVTPTDCDLFTATFPLLIISFSKYGFSGDGCSAETALSSMPDSYSRALVNTSLPSSINSSHASSGTW